MIPLESTTAILPRMPTGRTISGDFPLTIIKPPIVDVRCGASPSAISSPIIRLLRSRNQRRNSSASSVRSNCSRRTEYGEFLPERVEVVEVENGAPQNMQIKSVFRAHKQSCCTSPDNICNCHAISSRRGSLISSATERRINLQDEPFGKENRFILLPKYSLLHLILLPVMIELTDLPTNRHSLFQMSVMRI